MNELVEIFAGLALMVAIVGFLAAAAEAIVEGLAAPIFDRYETLRRHKFWLLYVSWAVSFALVLMSNVNLFADFIPPASAGLTWAGRILTGLIAGRGSNFLHDFFSAKQKQVEVRKMLAIAASSKAAFYQTYDLAASDGDED